MGLAALLALEVHAAEIVTRNHRVPVVSTVPAIAGQRVQLYLRERVARDVRPGARHDKVVLFVHGAGTPAEVAFDVPRQGYSWMAHLAAAGYDVFSVDLTGYGRSTRPAPMADRCNLAPAQQESFGTSCLQKYPGALTNIESDWHDIDAAVEYIAKLRGVDRIDLVGWSQGGPRAGGWAALHPERVRRLVLLAPAYNPAAGATAPALPVPGPVFNTQTHEEFMANWRRQAPCVDQYEPAVADTVWREMLASDPVGARWKPPVRRAPIASSSWGWSRDRVMAMTTPTLLFVGEHDAQVAPARVRDLHADLGSASKVLVELRCASHNAMWERNRKALFDASLEWLERGTVQGRSAGVLALGE